MTTTAVAVAACWPENRSRPVVLEADPSGGDVALRAGLAARPGALDAAAAAPSGMRHGGLRSWAQHLPCGVDVVAGPATRRQATAAATVLAATPALLAGGVVLGDVGRLEEPSPAAGFIKQAAALVVLCAPELASLAHTAGLIADLRRRDRTRPIWLVLTGSGPYTDPVEVAGAVGGTAVLGVLPDDPRGAAAVFDRGARQLRRTRLGRAARHVAIQLADKLAAPPGNGRPWAAMPPQPPANSSGALPGRMARPDSSGQGGWPPEPPR